jgi:hypothetical protein
MRARALAAVCGLALLAAGVASAETWTDPNGRVTFEAPRGWSTQARRADGFSAVISGTANNECQIIAQPNDQTATATPDRVRAAAADPAQFTTETWTRIASSLTNVFPGGTATVNSTSVDTSGAWPIQRAEIQSSERVVHAAMTLRPGVDIITMCMTYGGADTTDVYDGVIRSIAHPNDAQWAAAPTPAPAPAPAQ